MPLTQKTSAFFSVVSRPAAVIAAGVAWLLAASPAFANKVEIEHVNCDDFAEKGVCTLFLNYTNKDGEVRKDLDKADSIKVFLNKEEVVGDVDVATAKEANELAAVAVLVAATDSYSTKLDGQNSVLDLLKQGYKNFFGSLPDGSFVSVWCYSEDTPGKVADEWSTETEGAGDALAQCKPASERSTQAPPLYSALKKVYENISENDDLPRRKIILVVTDGKDKLFKNEALLTSRKKKIVELAEQTGAKVYAIGFTGDTDEFMPSLTSTARKTNGLFRRIPDEEFKTIPDQIESIATEIGHQYVLTWKPKEYSGSGEKPVDFAIEVDQSGRTMRHAFPEGIAVPDKPFEIWPILKWVLVGLGSLLGLFLLFKIIGAIARRRANRGDEVVEEEEYVPGAYKGKLTVQSGDYAGAEFFLTEDVTTIGSLAGNTIVLQTAGVSKRHSGIKIEDMRFELADFGSTNGTYVNGSRITKQFLRDGDLVQIGEAHMKFTLK